MTRRPFEPIRDKPNDGSLTVICEPDHFPCSYDAYWLIINTMWLMREQKYEKLKFWFRGFDDETRARLGLGNPEFIKGPIKDILDMFHIPVVEECTGHSVGRIPYNMSAATNIFRKYSLLPPRCFPSEQATEWAYQFLGAITITIRMTRHYHARNSNIGDWLDFAGCLRRGGNRVIFIPDTRFPDMKFLDFETSPQAATQTQYRAALYGVATQNLGVANGPISTFCWGVNDIPYICFETKASTQQFDAEHNKFEYFDITSHKEDTSRTMLWLGMERGEQIPWHNPAIQRIVWNDDTLENMIKIVDEMYPDSAKNVAA